MTDRWRQYFERQGVFGPSWLAEAVDHWRFNETLHGMIMRHIPRPAKILDVGCGPAFSDLYLTAAGYQVTGVDNDESVITIAREFASRLNIPTELHLCDAFHLDPFYKKFDLVYSCGVLEHFDRDVTVQLLEEQSRCARKVLIQIPTRFTAYTAPLTDERIYTVKELKTIVRDAGLKVRASFGYGDLAATRSQALLRQMLPRGLYRVLQNAGFAYSIAVLGERVE